MHMKLPLLQAKHSSLFMKTLHFKNIVVPLFVTSLFLTSSYLSDVFAAQLQSYVGSQGAWGMLLYVALITLTMIIPFGTSIPLVPISVAFWGGFAAALLNTAGWMIGGIVTFLIARRYRDFLMSRVALLKNIEHYGRMIPEKNLFLSVIILRMGPPVDFVSYAIGLFTNMHFLPYLTASFIGMIALAFFLSYVSLLSLNYQLLVIGVALGIALLGYLRIKKPTNN